MVFMLLTDFFTFDLCDVPEAECRDLPFPSMAAVPSERGRFGEVGVAFQPRSISHKSVLTV